MLHINKTILIDFTQIIQATFNITVWNGWWAYATYTEENDGWVVTAFDVRTTGTANLVFNELSPTNWTEIINNYPGATGVIVSGIFTRAGNYYVLNLFFPLLVIVLIANSTIFMPADGTEKAELQVINCYCCSKVTFYCLIH